MRKHRYKGLMRTIQCNICGDGYDAEERADEIFQKAKRKIDKAYQQGCVDGTNRVLDILEQLDVRMLETIKDILYRNGK